MHFSVQDATDWILWLWLESESYNDMICTLGMTSEKFEWEQGLRTGGGIIWEEKGLQFKLNPFETMRSADNRDPVALVLMQVWFQNRRSKERRMKQLSALGARRHAFFRGPRRMRPLGGRLEDPDILGPGAYGYYGGKNYFTGSLWQYMWGQLIQIQCKILYIFKYAVSPWLQVLHFLRY